MSENFPMDQVPQAADAFVKSAAAGVLLKRAREARGLHIGALAVTLKVPVRKLEALEADHHEVVGDLVFTRALAGSVCRVLKIDAAPVLAALPHSEMPPVKTDDAGLNTPFKSGGVSSGQPFKSRLTSPMGLAVVLLLLGILALVLWPESEAPALLPTRALPVSETEVVVPVPALDPIAAGAPAPQASEVPVALAVSVVAQDTPAGPVVGASNVTAVLVLESRGASWVEVTDARGVMQLRRILAAGEQVRFQGPLPLSVVLGRADDVTVTVRGQRLDMTAMTKANVARFEVK